MPVERGSPSHSNILSPTRRPAIWEGPPVKTHLIRPTVKVENYQKQYLSKFEPTFCIEVCPLDEEFEFPHNFGS